MKAVNKTVFAISALGLSLTSCTTTSDQRDPYENYNRKMYAFNDSAYQFLRPAARAYDAVVPDSMQTGIFNFFNNLREPGRIVNDLFQGEFSYAGDDSKRFLTNTTIGLLGFMDIADEWYGKEMRYHQGFAVTLHKWGVYGDNDRSPYIVWPLLGPGTLEDVATGVDALFNPLTYTFLIPGVGVAAYAVSYGTTAAYYANQGVSYLPAYDNLQEVSVDPYIAMRNAYLQYYDYGMGGVLKKDLRSDNASLETDAAVLGVLGLDSSNASDSIASSGNIDPNAKSQAPVMLKSKNSKMNDATKVQEAFDAAYSNNSDIVDMEDLQGASKDEMTSSEAPQVAKSMESAAKSLDGISKEQQVVAEASTK